MAVAPSNSSDSLGKERVGRFKNFVFKKYPAIVNNKPFSYPFIQIFESDHAIETYVTSSSYGTLNYPRIGLAVIFSGGASAMEYPYTLRVNPTNVNAPEQEGWVATVYLTTPPTSRSFDSLANVDDVCHPWDPTGPKLGPHQDSCTYQYIYNGALVIQRLVNDWIIDDSGAGAKGYNVAEHGVQFVPFPSKQYTTAGFYGTIGGKLLLSVKRLDWYADSLLFPLLLSLCSSSCYSGFPLSCCLHDASDNC